MGTQEGRIWGKRKRGTARARESYHECERVHQFELGRHESQPTSQHSTAMQMEEGNLQRKGNEAQKARKGMFSSTQHLKEEDRKEGKGNLSSVSGHNAASRPSGNLMVACCGCQNDNA